MMKKVFAVGLLGILVALGCGKKSSTPSGTAPTANFSWTWTDTNTNSKIDVGEQVGFTDTSTPGTGTITAWSWTFTGGTPASSTTQHPQGVTFASSGFKAVTLLVTADDGLSSSITKYVPINDPSDTTAPTLDVTSVTLKGTATDNVGVTILQDNAEGSFGNVQSTSPALPAASTNFTTRPKTTGSAPGDWSGTVTIRANDAAGNGPTDVVVTITETVVPVP
jgi:hypothetical protein